MTRSTSFVQRKRLPEARKEAVWGSLVVVFTRSEDESNILFVIGKEQDSLQKENRRLGGSSEKKTCLAQKLAQGTLQLWGNSWIYSCDSSLDVSG